MRCGCAGLPLASSCHEQRTARHTGDVGILTAVGRVDVGRFLLAILAQRLYHGTSGLLWQIPLYKTENGNPLPLCSHGEGRKGTLQLEIQFLNIETKKAGVDTLDSI